MLLWNLDAPIMHMIIIKLYSRVLQATIWNGQAAGQDVLITPMSLTPSNTIYKFKRLQFPIKPSFAMTINKA
uniref:ATP-dependent DNA helicase n=1 Tax=Octopus bimaculoides TaxID=37653 RepID=A0A0L8HAB6_OCTBM